MHLNIDHQSALGFLEDAYELIQDFDDVIRNTMCGDHPRAGDVVSWLDRFEAEMKDA